MFIFFREITIIDFCISRKRTDLSSCYIDTKRHTSLRKICYSSRLGCRNSQHSRNRNKITDNHSNIRKPILTKLFKSRTRKDFLLHKNRIWSVSKCIISFQYRYEFLFQCTIRQYGVSITIPIRKINQISVNIIFNRFRYLLKKSRISILNNRRNPLENKNSLSFTSFIWFCNKNIWRQRTKIKIKQLFTISNISICLRNRYSSLFKKLLRLILVISKTNIFFWIKFSYIFEISSINTKDRIHDLYVEKINTINIINTLTNTSNIIVAIRRDLHNHTDILYIQYRKNHAKIQKIYSNDDMELSMNHI